MHPRVCKFLLLRCYKFSPGRLRLRARKATTTDQRSIAVGAAALTDKLRLAIDLVTTMSTKLVLTAACCFLLLLLLNGAHHVEARRHRERRKDYMLLVFGDSFADAGNRLMRSSAKSRASRGWYYPYGSSDSAHRNRATGRLSDGLVQSDFLGTYVVAHIIDRSSAINMMHAMHDLLNEVAS